MRFPPQAHYGLRQSELDFLLRTMQDNPDLDVIDALVQIGVETGYMNPEHLTNLQTDFGSKDGDSEP